MAKRAGIELLHVHSAGSAAVFVLLAKLLRLRVVLTLHTLADFLALVPEGKPFWLARRWVWLAERVGVRHAHAVIAVSRYMCSKVMRQHGRRPFYLPNGVRLPAPARTQTVLRKLNLEPGGYILSVGRIAPQKGFLELVQAFRALQCGKWRKRMRDLKLVIAGDRGVDRQYVRKVKASAQGGGILFTGLLSGRALKELYTHAGLFVLHSHHEGLALAALEAVSYGLPCVLSDIPPNRELDLGEECYFAPGDVEELAEKIAQHFRRPLSAEERRRRLSLLRRRFCWEEIAGRTRAIYAQAAGK